MPATWVNTSVAADEGDPKVLEDLFRVRVTYFEEFVVGGHLRSNTNDGRVLQPFPLLFLCVLKTHPIPPFLSFASFLRCCFLGATRCFPIFGLLDSRFPDFIAAEGSSLPGAFTQFIIVRLHEICWSYEGASLWWPRFYSCFNVFFFMPEIGNWVDDQETGLMIQYLRGVGVLELPDLIRNSDWPSLLLFAFMTSSSFNGRSSTWHTLNLSWVSTFYWIGCNYSRLNLRFRSYEANCSHDLALRVWFLDACFSCYLSLLSK